MPLRLLGLFFILKATLILPEVGLGQEELPFCPGNQMTHVRNGTILLRSYDGDPSRMHEVRREKGLIFLGDESSHCSGALVSPCLILTAEHCGGRVRSARMASHQPHLARGVDAKPTELKGGQRAPYDFDRDWQFFDTERRMAVRCQRRDEHGRSDREFGANSFNHNVFVVRVRGQTESCHRYQESQVILCPEKWELSNLSMEIQGYPGLIRRPEPRSGLRSGRNDDRIAIETRACTGDILNTGRIRHRCVHSAGMSGGPILADIRLKNGEMVKAIVGVTAGSSTIDEPSRDAQGFNYGTTPQVTQVQLNQILSRIQSCESGQWQSKVDGKSCTLVQESPPAVSYLLINNTCPSFRPMPPPRKIGTKTTTKTFFCKGATHVTKTIQEDILGTCNRTRSENYFIPLQLFKSPGQDSRPGTPDNRR